MNRQPLIVSALLDPGSLGKLSELEWDLLIRQGRRANLLARLAHLLTEANLLEYVPESPRWHLLSSQILVIRQEAAVRREAHCIRAELTDADSPIILLKGAAYVMAQLPTAQGRVFTDIDILVPRSKLALVETELLINGWRGMHHSSYDQKYYRRWMHEIPPLMNSRRGTVIDVHHAILPDTARIKVNSPALLKAAIPLTGLPGVFVLSSADMVLHSATHLFHEGELDNGLRDLFDLDSLLRDFGKNPEFWDNLAPRARELGLLRPLYYAVRYTSLLLGTPIPEATRNASLAGRPPLILRTIMDYCYTRALLPVHSSCNTAGTTLSRFALYIRSHWIRMPLHLLVYHLTRKALTRPKSTVPVEGQDDPASKRNDHLDQRTA